MSDLRVRLGSLELANPVLVSAGTFGYGLEFRSAVPLERLGAVVTKTLTAGPRLGNPAPRLVETPSGLLNAVGLQNVGLKTFLEGKLPMLRTVAVPLIVSVWAESVEEMAEMVARLEAADGVDAVELNLSCPNVRHPQGLVSQDAEATTEMVRAARASTRKPLIAKLTPDVTDPRPIAQAAERAGADALALVNTFAGMSLDPRTRRSRIGSLTGGVSGPAIRPLAVYRVWLVHQAVRCPIIGMGGIVRGEDAVEFFLAGATAISVGTANFANPATPLIVLRDVERYLAQHRLAAVTELIGAVQDETSSRA